MNDRWLTPYFTASSLIHLSLIPVAALVMHAKPIRPVTVPVELIDIPRVEQPKKVEVPPPPPAPKAKPQNITAPKLLSKPVLETTPLPPTGNTKEEIKSEEPVDELPKLASLPDNTGAAKAGWNVGTRAAEAEGGAAGTGNLFGKGDVGVVGGSGVGPLQALDVLHPTLRRLNGEAPGHEVVARVAVGDLDHVPGDAELVDGLLEDDPHRVEYGSRAISRAFLTAMATSRWCCTQLPVTRRARILPRSETNLRSIIVSL